MFDSITSSTTRGQQRIGRLAWTTAWFGLVAGQFHAMARHQTADGKADLDLPLTRLWSDPGRETFRPLLDWASPDVVYLTWGKIWLPVFVALTLCAFVVHRRRRPTGFERWAWRVALTGYVGGCVAVVGEYWTSYGTPHQAIVDGVFPFTVVAMLTTLVGSTMLGIALLRRGFRPRTPAVLLALAIPEMIAITQVTSMGSVVLPMAFAFGILGRRLAAEEPEPAVVVAPAVA